jgi:AcrR family transcriptional regulator
MARQIRDPMLRQRIVDAAFTLLARGGMATATMRGIAAEAGVSTGSVTHYFQDKAEIVAAVLSGANRRMATLVGEAIAGRRGLDALSRAALAMLPIDQERLDTWRMWIAFWPGEFGATGSGFGNRYRQWRAMVVDRLTEAVEDGELPAHLDVRAEAERLTTLLAGVGFLSGTDLATEDRFVDRARGMITGHLDSLGRDPLT